MTWELRWLDFYEDLLFLSMILPFWWGTTVPLGECQTVKWSSIVELENTCGYLRWGDGTIPLQSGCVPNLGFNREAIQVQSPCTELHTNSGPAVMVELVLSKARKQVALAYARFPYENHWGNIHRGDYKAMMFWAATGSDLYYLATVVRKSVQVGLDWAWSNLKVGWRCYESFQSDLFEIPVIIHSL